MKNLIILDLCGLLLDKYHEIDVKNELFDFKTSNNYYIYKRPYLDVFINFIFSHFLIGIWSSISKEDTYEILSKILSDVQFEQLEFIFTLEDCNIKGFLQTEQPIYLKDLKKIWNLKKFKNYQFNTLLIDDSPYKSVLNPEYTSIHTRTFCYLHKYDSELIDMKNFLMKILGQKLNIKSFLNRYSYNKFSLLSEDRITFSNENIEIQPVVKPNNKKNIIKHISTLLFVFGLFKFVKKRNAY